MKLNPYTFLYCSFYRFLENKTREKDRISFGVQSFIGIAFILYFVITSITIKTNCNLSLGVTMNKYVFGFTTTILYFTINYLIFDKNNRYQKLLIRLNNISKPETIIHVLFWIIVLLIPFISKILCSSA
jgi:hypothetical protein